MLILTIKTDNPHAEIALYENRQLIADVQWQAHRELAETIHIQIEKLLQENNKSLEDLEGMACYEGPGSFTGLRIGMSVANAIASSYSLKIIAKSGDRWMQDSISDLLEGNGQEYVVPEYGAPAITTTPKK